MSHEVVILPRAKRELYNAAIWWAENRSREQAARWLDGFERKLASLADDPERLPVANEDAAFSFTLRELLFGVGSRITHRAVFEIRESNVLVHAIRHVAQQDLSPDELI